MIRNYFVIALRNLLRHRLYSLLNVTGLAVGLATSILILLWVLDETSFDRFHASAGQIYRITADVSGTKLALTPPPMADHLSHRLTQVTHVAQVASGKRLMRVGDKSADEKRVLFVDSAFFLLFNFPLLNDDLPSPIEHNAVLLTEAMARKYFGRTDVVGSVIQVDNQYDFIISGVLKSVPGNSHLQFDFLLPMSFYHNTPEYQQANCWDCYYSIYTYLKLTDDDAQHTAATAVTAQINQLYAGQKVSMKADFSLQALTDIHLQSQDLIADIAVRGNIHYVDIFSWVALVVLVIASVNFMNLATARSVTRAKEAGMRKVMGAHTRQLIGQFLGESFIITCVSLVFALVLVTLALPAFNALTGKGLRLSWHMNFIGGLTAVVVLTSVLSGSYPAFYFSTVKAIRSLKGTIKAGRNSVLFRNALVVTQFIVTIVLIACATVVHRQIQFIKQQDLGYQKQNLLYAPMNRDMLATYPALLSELDRNNTITDYTVVSELPTNMQAATYAVDWQGKDDSEQIIFSLMGIDERFVSTFGVTLLNGRSFSRNFTADTANFVVNEKALSSLGFDPATAVGKKLTVNGKAGTIIGVVKDFHFKPFQDLIQPLIMTLNTTGGVVVVRTPPGAVQSHVATLQQVFTKLTPAYPFEYGFLNRDFDALYRTEAQVGTLAGGFTVLAVFIACLGLFGLSAFMAEQRTREIGVRKLVGATVGSIVLLLSKGLAGLVLIASLVAMPVAWYIAARWLDNYAYHVPLHAAVFMGAGIVALLVALLTTCFQTVKAALSNPAQSLRHH